MDDLTRLNQSLVEIGGRFIKRTLGELGQLQQLLEQARAGNTASMKDIERMAHKIAGSGAMFGFDAVSERAQALEICAEGGATDTQSLQRLAEHIAALDTEVRAAARDRGLE
jgi:HPt (histidine-containing phosphotransfer) domain-containing protein